MKVKYETLSIMGKCLQVHYNILCVHLYRQDSNNASINVMTDYHRHGGDLHS